MNDEVTKNDKAWKRLFDKYKILDAIDTHGYFQIDAAQINEFREARLMTKFDHKANLPELFSKHNLAILPITRGSYIISRFDAYKEIEPIDSPVTKVAFPEYLESINYESITSESIALNCAYVSNILSNFLEDDDLLPTVNGRMKSGCFSYFIKAKDTSVKVDVTNAQIEIDGGYEGRKKLALVEAKNFIPDDFIIRQLYYPYRSWIDKVSKKVATVFMIYSNGKFSLYEYDFANINDYNSLFLIKKENYGIDIEKITLDDINNILLQVKVIQEPELPFPQADNFERVINLCELLLKSELTKDEITYKYAFDPRQTNYYTDAGRYLSLIEKYKKDGQIIFSLTLKGMEIVKSKYKARQLGFAKSIMEHGVFNETLKTYLKSQKMPSKDEIVDIMKRLKLYRVNSRSTYERRASTVYSWVNWILNLCKIN